MLEKEFMHLKEPMRDFRMMIEAAIEALYRRRKQVYKYYEMKEQVDQ
jgi:hypothetical protein